MVRYRCSKCSYSFEPKADRVPKRCPYCGCEKLLLDETAGDILRSL